MRISWIKTATAIVTVGVIGVAATLFKAHGATPPQSKASLKRITAPAWPEDQTFSWTYPIPSDLDTKHGIQLRLRRNDLPLPQKNEGVILSSQTSSMQSAEAKAEFGTGMALNSVPGAAPSEPGSVTIQLLDLTSIGAASTRPGQTLRVLAKFSFGSAIPALSGDNIFLPAGSFAGTSWRDTGTWENGELYLMSFYVQGDTAVYKYDVFLQEAAVPAAH